MPSFSQNIRGVINVILIQNFPWPRQSQAPVVRGSKVKIPIYTVKGASNKPNFNIDPAALDDSRPRLILLLLFRLEPAWQLKDLEFDGNLVKMGSI